MPAIDALSDDEVRSILTSVSTIAVVGASANPARPPNGVLGFLIARGFETFPVNPGHAGGLIRGRKTYARLADVPSAIDMVDVFRNSGAVGGVVDEALQLNPLPRVIWMQLGVADEEAAKLGRAKAITVVMNRCPSIEFRRLFGGPQAAARQGAKVRAAERGAAEAAGRNPSHRNTNKAGRNKNQTSRNKKQIRRNKNQNAFPSPNRAVSRGYRRFWRPGSDAPKSRAPAV